MAIEQYVGLSVFGFLVGAFGTLIGAGGGFILAPVLLLLYPDESPTIITSISLAVVFLNASSGSVAYARMGRIDYRSGLLFALAAIPGSILGAMSTAIIPRNLFDGVFGVVLIAVAVFLLFSSKRSRLQETSPDASRLTRQFTDKEGVIYDFNYNPVWGTVLSGFIGFLSSFLGIGGGIIHVPILIRLLDFPVHIATATSQFILAIMALTGTIVHFLNGSLSRGMPQTAALGVGVLVGAQVGAALSSKVNGKWIIRSLAIALGIVGSRILLLAW